MSFEMLKLDEAARRAKISPRMLHTRIKRGEGPAITRIGGARRVRSDMLDTWLIECTVQKPPTRQAA